MLAVKLLPELVGDSQAMTALRESIARLLRRPRDARRLPPVLILGETGTGKGLVARLLHRAGPRSDGPFVDVNCAAIPETLLEAEMFGYEKGAFTDARRAKPGLFQTAHRGTLFLDEVGLLPEALQAKLLKVLEGHTVRRLGSTRDEPVDAWILTATNEDLRAAIRERRFREDLYHRLAVLTLAMPPLRERDTDVLALAEHFLERACADYGLPPKRLTADARARLLAYRWPGNVRELANVIERAVLLAGEAEISAAMLALNDEASAPPSRPPAAGTGASLHDAMRDHILQVLTETGWNISRSAATLGMARNTLRARIERYGLQPADRPGTSRPAPSPQSPAEPAAVVPTAAPMVSGPAPQRWESRRITILRAAFVPSEDDHQTRQSGQLLDELLDKVETFGGKVEGVGRIGLLAVFGVDPVEEAPIRAANAAMAMIRAVDRARRDEGAGAAIRVALHVGQAPLAVSTRGIEIDMAARGRLWALADDLVANAEPNTIVVSDAATTFFKRRFEMVRLPTATGEPIHRLVGPERPGVGLAAHVPALVGRRHEVELLGSRLQSALRGRGQVVGISGEPGIGKSRLIMEFRRSASATLASCLEAHCHAYGVAMPYLPIVQLVRGQLGVVDADTPEAITAKVRDGLRGLGLGAPEAASALLQILGVKNHDGVGEIITPEATKSRIFDTLRNMVLRVSRRRPLILVIEDLHWIDRTSEELLASLIEGIAAAPVLIATTYRFEYQPPWTGRSYVTQIALQPLTHEESVEVLRAVLGPREVRPELLDAVAARAEGNPFFLEELALASADVGDARVQQDVPATIQEIVLTRMARLAEPARRLLQEASVLGRVVSPQLLAAMRTGVEPLDVLVRNLAHVEFLYEEAGADEIVYVFKHALTQEVAYETLPAADRAALHGAAARALERQYTDRLDEACDRIAYHYSRTAEDDKAVHYLRLAAARSARAYGHAEAIEALRRARERVERHSDPDADVIDLLLLEAHSLHVLGRFQETLDLLRAHEVRVERLADAARSGPYYFWMARTASVLGDAAATGPNVRRAIEFARASRDDATLGKAYFMLAYEDYWSGHPVQGVEHGRQAVAMLERTDERWWQGMAHWIVALNCIPLGDFAGGRAATGRARAIGDAIGDLRLQNYADWTCGWIDTVCGDVAAALEACRRAQERSQDPVNGAYATGHLGCAYLEGGEHQRAIPLIESAISQFAGFNVRQTRARFMVSLSEAYLASGQLEEAERLARDALTLGSSVGFQYAIGFAQRALGQVANARGDAVTARARYDEALTVFRSMQAGFEEARTGAAIAELVAARDVTSAAPLLRRAVQTFDQLGAPRHASRARQLAVRLGVTL